MHHPEAPTGATPPTAHIFLLQLGGPKDLNSIKPFLLNLFADVLPGPAWFRRAMGWFIAWRRTPKVMPQYTTIGGGSPLLRNTEAQAQALEKKLHEAGHAVRCHIVMRYAPPRLDEALACVAATAPDAPLVALPLYPHYSYATTRSSLMEMSDALTPAQRARFTVVDAYFTEPHYIDAVSALTLETLEGLKDVPAQDVHIVYSAHGLPLKLVREGDPYPEHVQATVAALAARLPKPYPWTLSYQSRVGPVKWLTPSTQETMVNLGKASTPHVVVVPVSFVSEHIETLHELDIELRDEALHHGVQTYRRVPTVGTHPAFIESLSQLTQQALAQPAPFAEAECVCDPRRRNQGCLCIKALARRWKTTHAKG